MSEHMHLVADLPPELTGLNVTVPMQNLTDYLTNQDRFLWVLLIFDLSYPLIAYAQKKMMGSYPGRRFLQTLPDAIGIWTHIISGFWIIYSLGAIFLVNKYSGTETIESISGLIRFCAITVLIHAASSLYMLPIVHGEQVITQPLYFGMIAMNIYDSIDCLIHPDYSHAMMMWGAVNALILVRFFYMSLVAYTYIDRKLLYTFAIAAAYSGPLLVGHDSIWLVMYGFPACYGVIVFVYRSIPRNETICNMKEGIMRPPAKPSKAAYKDSASGLAAVNIEQDVVRVNENSDSDRDSHNSEPGPVLLDDLNFDGLVGGGEGCRQADDITTSSEPAGGNWAKKSTGGMVTDKMVTIALLFAFGAGFSLLGLAKEYHDEKNGVPLPYVVLDSAKSATPQTSNTISQLNLKDPRPQQTLSPLDPADFISTPLTVTGETKVMRQRALELKQNLWKWEPRRLLTFPTGNQTSPLFGGPGGPVGSAAKVLDKNSFYVNALMPHYAVYIAPVINSTLEGIKRFDRFRKWEDFDQLFQYGFPMPLQSRSYFDDVLFAYEQTSITGTFTTKIHSLPEQMRGKLTDFDVRGLLPKGVNTLDEAFDYGLVYGVDLACMDKLDHPKIVAGLKLNNSTLGLTRYTVGTIAIFVHHNATAMGSADDARLMPLGIWLGTGSNLVFTPNDNEVDWMLAKMYFLSANKIISHIRHVLRDHMLQEPHLVSAERNLAPNHPVYALIKHHGYLGVGITEFIYQQFMTAAPNDPTTVDQVLGIGSDNLQRLVQREYEVFDYESVDPIATHELAGTLDLPNNHYRDDNTALYWVIDRFVRNYMSTYYKSDADVQADYELQNFAAEMVNMDKGRVKGFPSHILTFEKLVRVVAHYIWRNSVHHSSNSGEYAYDYLGHPLSFIVYLTRPPPAVKGTTSLQDVFDMMPVPEHLVYAAGILRALKRYLKPQHTLQYAYEYAGLGPRAKDAVEQYKREMLVESEKMRARKKRQMERNFPSGNAYLLDPQTTPYWGWL